MKSVDALSSLERHAFACLAFGTIGDAMGSPTESLEPEEIERRFKWVETFAGDGTDDTIMRDLLAKSLIATGGYATADDWAAAWKENRAAIFGDKVNRFFPSILHAAEKIRYNYPPHLLAVGTMPSSTSAMAIAPVGIVNAGHPVAAAAQAAEIASLIHVGENAFCQHGAAAIAAAVAAALAPGASVHSVLEAAVRSVRGWRAEEMRTLIQDALDLARASNEFRAFRGEYHKRFQRAIPCDSRETVPATLAIVALAAGDPDQAIVLGANFGRDTDTIACMAGGICGALQGLTPSALRRISQMSPNARQFQIEEAVQLVATSAAKASIELAAWAHRL